LSTGASANNRLANTKERDFSIGLDNHGFRYFDAECGRYISADPVGFQGGLNWYAYVFNNPINHIDPLGLDPQTYSHFTDVEGGEGIVNDGKIKAGESGYVYLTDKPSSKGIGKEPAAGGVRVDVKADLKPEMTIQNAQWSAWYEDGKAKALARDPNLAANELQAAADGYRNGQLAEFIKANGKSVYEVKTSPGKPNFIIATEKALEGGGARIVGIGGEKAGEVIGRLALAGKSSEAATAAEAAGLSKAAAARFGKAATVIKYAGKPLVAVAVALDLWSIHEADYSAREVTRVAAGWTGAWLGMKLGAKGGAIGGAKVGAFFKGVGAVPGAAIGAIGGAIGGGIAGYWAGSKTAETVYDWTFDGK